jgi:hypothetical protein
MPIANTMKFLTLITVLILFVSISAEAQLRKDLNSTYQNEDFSSTVTHTHSPSSPGNWMNLLNMTMSHSYSMSFSNFGGQMQNLNAYTNSMFFDVSDRLDAQLNISVLHSPFGNSFMNNNNALNSQIIIDSARIDYKFSENTRISLQFSQNPYYSPYGNYGFGNYHSPFNRRPLGY